MDIQAAVERLNTILPLKARQDHLTVSLKQLHQAILRSFIERGRSPTREELAMNISAGDLDMALSQLGDDDLIVLDVHKTTPVGAYPLTSEPTPHKVRVDNHSLYAMCALDAIAIAPMFGKQIHIESQCHIDKIRVELSVNGSGVIETRPDSAMIGIRWQTPTSVAAYSLCREMIFLGDKSTAESWRDGDPQNISLFTPQQAFELGKRFFLPLME